MNKPKLSEDLYYVYGGLILLFLLGLILYFSIQDQIWRPLFGNITTDAIFIFLAVFFVDRRIDQAKQKQYFPLAHYLIKGNFSILNVILSRFSISRISDPETTLLINDKLEVLLQNPKNLDDFEMIVQTRKILFLSITGKIKPLLSFKSSELENREKALSIINPLLQDIYLREIILIRDKIRTEQIPSIFPDIGLIFYQINDCLTHIINIGNMLQATIKNANMNHQQGETQEQFFVFTCSPNEISISSVYLLVIFEKLKAINELFINCDNSTRSKLLDAINSNE